jgi:uncharacterized protein YdcH (DUF465 family)
MLAIAHALGVLCLVLSCATATKREDAMRDAEPPKLVAQRVTATVKREAARLVQIQTEHDALLTTPEHPFATPDSGWIPAGRLVRGDRIVSARFGTVRVLSVQNEKPAQPQHVFNLTVDPSHAYVVGADQVLVHNTKCKDPAEREREIAAAERELRELNQQLENSAEDGDLKQRIAQAKTNLAKLKKQARDARDRLIKKGLTAGLKVTPPPKASGIAQTTQAIEALERKIEAIKDGTSPSSTQQLAELQRERLTLKNRLRVAHHYDKTKNGIAPVPQGERLLKRAEAEYASRKQELDAAQRELSELLGETPQSDAEKKSHAERKAALEKKIEDLQVNHDAAKEILAWERKIAELAERSPSTAAERQEITQMQRDLREKIAKKRKAQNDRENDLKRRLDPEAYEKRLRDNREGRHRRLRTPAYVADTERPRDTLELLEEELAGRRQAGILDDRTEYLTERIATLEALVELRRERDGLGTKLGSARAARRRLIRAGKDTTETDREIARLAQELAASKPRLVQLRLREKLLAKLDGTTWTDPPGAVDEARLRELERELARDLAGGGSLPEERLREIGRELEECELIDAEFLESIWREAEAQEAALQDTAQ